MIRKTLILLPAALLLLGCSQIARTPQVSVPDSEKVATIVAATLTAKPTITSEPEVVADQVTPTEIPDTPVPTETATSLPTATTEPTLTPTRQPSPTLDPEDPRITLGNPSWKAALIDDTNWYTFETEQSSVQVVDSKLVLTANKANNYESWSMSWPKVSDFYLEMTATTGDTCQEKDRYGLIVRAPDPNQGYLFGFSCDGAFRIRKWDGEKYTELAGWEYSDSILTGPRQSNRLGVMAEGAKLSIYANGHLLEKIQDDTYEKGVFGTYIAASKTPGFTVFISEVAYWELP